MTKTKKVFITVTHRHAPLVAAYGTPADRYYLSAEDSSMAELSAIEEQMSALEERMEEILSSAERVPARYGWAVFEETHPGFDGQDQTTKKGEIEEALKALLEAAAVAAAEETSTPSDT